MNVTTEAEEHLRVIRTLMERATIYRAISAPTALVGGVTAVIAALCSKRWPQHFFGWWLLALAITLSANTIFIWRAAAKRHEPLFSPSFKLALVALFPPCLAGGIISLLIAHVLGSRIVVAIVWTIFYGLALLATAHFSPRSLVILGWAFLLTGICAFILQFSSAAFIGVPFSSDEIGSYVMGVTFGLFHLVYAVCTWPRKVA